MPRPTEREALIMKIRKLIKEIWEQDCNREKEEITHINYNDNTNFVKIVISGNSTDIHKSTFENYFNAKDNKEKQYVRDKIKKSLEAYEDLRK